jgi:hypothetical protein
MIALNRKFGLKIPGGSALYRAAHQPHRKKGAPAEGKSAMIPLKPVEWVELCSTHHNDTCFTLGVPDSLE